MHIVITGATGFIGSYLCEFFTKSGFDVYALTRNAEKAEKKLSKYAKCITWDGRTPGEWKMHVDGAEAVINLAGANLADRLWTSKYKNVILESRINAGNVIAKAIKSAKKKPEVLFQGSAIGIYGNRGDVVLDESSEAGSGFLADVVQKWEKSVESVKKDCRIIYLRTGVVLGRGEGTLAKLSLPFKLFAGGPPGNGKQWFSWIHILDVVNIVNFLMRNKNLSGAFNLTAPNPVRMKQFCDAFGDAINRPSWLPVPAFALKLLLGEMAEETILGSQNVIPKKLQKTDFEFGFSTIEKALTEIYGNR